MDPSLPGVMQTLAVTVRQFEISSGVCNRFRPHVRPSLRFWQMDPSSPGVVQTKGVTVRQFKISSGVSSRLQATGTAFAAILEDGSVVTWGRADYGGDSSAVGDQLRGLQQIKATRGAFAAIQEDRSVVTWGSAKKGGDSSAVRDQLRGVQQIQASHRAFAAILEDGSVVTWGDAVDGVKGSAVRDQLRGEANAVPSLFVGWRYDSGPKSHKGIYLVIDYAAVKSQKSGYSVALSVPCEEVYVPPGDPILPLHAAAETALADFSEPNLTVQQIKASYGAFAAIQEDRSVVTWGSANTGGDSSEVQDQLKGVQHIQATDQAFAAILADGSVVTWGAQSFGGDSSAVRDQLRGVQQIQASYGAFAAILEDGSVVTWGSANFGGDSSAVQHELNFF